MEFCKKDLCCEKLQGEAENRVWIFPAALWLHFCLCMRPELYL